MHLENELRALRPEVGRPSAATVAEHRRALDTAIAEGRTASPGRRHPDDRRPTRWLVAAAAVLAVIVAGGVLWSATRSRDVRIDTGPADTPGPGTTATEPTTVLDAAASGSGAGAGAGDGASPTVTFAPDAPLTCGPDSPTGDSLPGYLQILPDETGATTGRPATFDADGRAVIRRENERYAVEALWPAPDRVLYAAEQPAGTPDVTDFGNVSMRLSPDAPTEVLVERQVGDVTPLRILTSGTVNVAPACRYVLFTVFERGRPIARFTYDLAAEASAAMVDRAPLVAGTRQVAAAPTEAVPCDGGPGAPPNDDLVLDGPVAPTPAEALDAYLATPEADFYHHSGFVELIAQDGTYTYGAPLDPGSPLWVTLVTVTPVEGGWAATHLRASGC